MSVIKATNKLVTVRNQQLAQLIEAIGKVVLGKENQIRLAITCLLAQGHLLIEDLPGMGKTTLAQVIARVFGLEFQRVQFTSDLLPADILGSNIFERSQGKFVFHPGPIYAQLVLADEVNRATPKTQSALLEAMEEHQVTIEGETRPLPTPFFVIATQNPAHQIGTYPLPESQLDRFLLRVELGYPEKEFERTLLKGTDRRDLLDDIEPVMSRRELLALQEQVKQVTVSDTLVEYVMELVQKTRDSAHFVHGLSPRGAISLIRAARAWALLHDRGFVLPEDVQQVFEAVSLHRLQSAGHSQSGSQEQIHSLLETTRVPD